MKLNKRKAIENREIALILIFIIVFAFILGIQSQPSQVQGSQKIIQNTNTVADYTISTTTISGTKYYQSTDVNNIIAFGGIGNLGGVTGTNFSAVIQASINTLQCGNIQLRPQIFNMTKGIKSYPCISITGVAGNGDFNIEPNTTVIYTTDLANPAITLEVNSLHTAFTVFPYLKGFTISGRGGAANTTADGIYVTDVNGNILDLTISDVKIFSVGGNCINLNTNAKSWLDTVYFEDCFQSGINGKGNQFITNSYIFGNQLDGVRHISGGLLNLNHNWIFNNVQRGVNCQNINNVCMILNDIFQNNGGTSFSQTVFATSATISANPLMFVGNTLTDTRSSGFASAFISIASASSQGIFESNYMWSSGSNVPCFSFASGGYITNGNLGNVIIKDNQFESTGSGCKVGKVTGNFLIGGTSGTTKHYIGAFGGNSTTVIASQSYTASNTDQYITCSGGTGVNIIVIDPLGNTIETIGACPTTTIDLPIGYAIDFGAFTGAPTVIDYVKSL